MADKTGIEWTDSTWGPTIGCDKVSPGCDHCYAIRVGARLQSNAAYKGTIAGGDWTGRVNMVEDRLDQPLRWKRPRRIFVDSMSDLFHKDVTDTFIARVFAVMGLANHHTFQVLTKRPQRMANLLGTDEFQRAWFEQREAIGVTDRVQQMANREEISLAVRWPLPNVWLGTSIENDRYTFRARHLVATPAAVRFLSLEPLIGPLPSLELGGIDWVIVGGESGPGARPMHPQWVRGLRDRCVERKVPFLFKQWGEWLPSSVVGVAKDPNTCAVHLGGTTAMTPDNHFNPFRAGHPDWRPMLKVGKRSAGRMLDGRTWDEYPEQAPA